MIAKGFSTEYHQASISYILLAIIGVGSRMYFVVCDDSLLAVTGSGDINLHDIQDILHTGAETIGSLSFL